MRKILFPLAVVLVLACALQVSAATLFSENFESYSDGTLAGQGPWVIDYAMTGPTSTNQSVYSGAFTSAYYGYSIPQLPGSTKMLAERPNGYGANWDEDYDAVNLAFHAGNGANLTGNFTLDWMFYDSVGGVSKGTTMTNGANYITDLYLSNFGGIPGGHELTADDPLSWDIPELQRIAVGGSNDYNGAYDRTKYQVQCVGVAGGYDSSWFNTPITRSVGWHQGQIIVGAAQADGTNDITINIDGILAFQGHPTVGGGFNLLELANPWISGAFDNISITSVPEPSSIFALGMGLVGLLGLIKRRK